MRLRFNKRRGVFGTSYEFTLNLKHKRLCLFIYPYLRFRNRHGVVRYKVEYKTLRGREWVNP